MLRFTPTFQYLRTSALLVLLSFAFLNAESQCTADFTAQDSACVGMLIEFTDISTVATGDAILTWDWDFGDGTSGFGQNINHTYIFPGIYTVSHAINTTQGCSDTVYKSIYIFENPNAYFTFTPNVCNQQVVQFTSFTSVAVSSYFWDFGDTASGSMNTSILQHPEHIYESAGTYTVLLRVENSSACYDSVMDIVDILGPDVDFSYSPTPTPMGSTVYFTDQSTSSSGYIAEWKWYFGDGDSAIVQFPNNPDVTHVYSDTGHYTLELCALDDAGCTSCKQEVLHVQDLVYPLADFSFQGTCHLDLTLFTDLSTTNGGGDLISWEWNFGDPASGSSNTSALQNPTHLFTSIGSYDVQLVVTNSDGLNDTTLQAVTIRMLPAVSIDVDPDTCTLGTPMQFYGNIISGAITSWSWDFGDGGTSVLQNPIHVYSGGGLYDVSLTVLDTSNCDNIAYAQVFVYEPPAFPEDNAIWNTVGGNSITSDTWRFRYGLIGDTILSPTNKDTSYTYSQVYSLYDSTLTNPNSTYFAAVRTTDDKKVYALIPGFPETLLYDFALEVGDTAWFEVGGALCYNHVEFWADQHFKIVTDIDSIILTNGEYRKRWFLDGAIMSDEWVDGFGSIVWYGLFNSLIIDIALCGDDYSFACFKEGNTIIYQNNPQCDACFCALLTSLEESLPEARNNLNIFPNPATNTVSISSDNIDIASAILEIYNAHGQIIYQSDMSGSNEMEIDISDWEKGVYIVRIINESQNIGSRKLIIQ